MVKRITSLNIEHSVVEEAKRLGLNLSEVAEKAIRIKSGEEIKELNKSKECWFCDREGTMETGREVLYKIYRPDALTLLNPDEKLICNRCLNMRLPKKRDVLVFA